MTAGQHPDSFSSRSTLEVAGTTYDYYRLDAVEGAADLPFSLKVLLENLLRTEDGLNVTADAVRALGGWQADAEPDVEIQFTPGRVVMQDFTGVPCIVDLATMREAVVDLGGDPAKVNPLAPAELVIDHSVIVDSFGTPDSLDSTWPWSTSATASATSSCAGARPPSATSSSCPRASASSTRSTSSASRAA
ncbi:aconitase family protein [Aquipuribacter hungaricus]|uniref:aconitase family protein n=1 Tax=Aquipuribacter hungaricus TaxID=545624 RepID=UPI003608FF8C